MQNSDKLPKGIVESFKESYNVPDEAWNSVLSKVLRILENDYGIVVEGDNFTKKGQLNYKSVLERIINTFIGMGNCYVHFFQSIYDKHKDDFDKLFKLMKRVGILINEEDGRIYIGMGDYDTEKMNNVVFSKEDIELIKRIAPVVSSIGMKKIMDYEFWELLDEKNLTRVFYGNEERLRIKFIAMPRFVEIPVKIKKKDFKDVLRREVGLIFNFDGDFEDFIETLISRSRLIRETKLSDEASSFLFALLEDLSQGWIRIVERDEKVGEGYFVVLDDDTLYIPSSIIEQTIQRSAKQFIYKKNRRRLMDELYAQGILKATSSVVKKFRGKSYRVWVFDANYPEIREVLKNRKKREKMTEELLSLNVES